MLGSSSETRLAISDASVTTLVCSELSPWGRERGIAKCSRIAPSSANSHSIAHCLIVARRYSPSPPTYTRSIMGLTYSVSYLAYVPHA